MLSETDQSVVRGSSMADLLSLFVRKLAEPWLRSTIFGFFSLMVYGVLLAGSTDTIRWYSREDGPFEWAGAIFLFIASGLMVVAYVKSSEGNDFCVFKTRKNIFYLLLAILFFFGCGEEISWGQRIFGWTTPEWWSIINLQGETNVHNIRLFLAPGMRWVGAFSAFISFGFLYFFVIPLLAQSVESVQALLSGMRLPVVPVHLGPLWLVNYVIFRVLRTTSIWSTDYGYLLWENSEAIYELICFLAAVCLYVQAETSVIAMSRKTGHR